MQISLASRFWSRALGLILLSGILVGSTLTRAEEPADKKPDAPKAADKPDVKWQSLFDGKTMAGWKPTEFGTGGEILVEKGQMVISFGDGCTGVTWQKDFPKVDYEVRVEAQRVEGTDFFCGMTFPVQESPCSLIVGGWGGTIVGLSSIDGDDASQNETTQFMSFKKGQWYNIRVRVTKTRITVWIDEKQVIYQETTGHKISIRPEVEKSRPFGICTWSTTAAVRKIELRKLTAEEAKPVKLAEPKKE